MPGSTLSLNPVILQGLDGISFGPAACLYLRRMGAPFYLT